jgi:hypothetical protein
MRVNILFTLCRFAVYAHSEPDLPPRISRDAPQLELVVVCIQDEKRSSPITWACDRVFMRTEGEEVDVDENEEAAEEWDHYFDDIEANVSFAEYSTKAAV